MRGDECKASDCREPVGADRKFNAEYHSATCYHRERARRFRARRAVRAKP